ncbi:MAG TPA: carbohydrate kinase family protein [Candidatus Saccharimonadales bacterium]|nr:carbohydrate kinase family protein [Candidatus Saccharimonadales bacterium]
MKILGIGESVVDNVYITHDISMGIDVVSSPSQKHVGGPVIAALILLSRLGLDCTLITTLGRDEDAGIIKRTLKREKVTLVGKMQKKTKIHTVIVNTRNGQRRKIRGDVQHPPIKGLNRKFLHQFDLIIIDRHEHTAFYEILKKKKTATKIIIDPSTEISPFTLDMIKHSDYPIVPIEALTKIGTGKDFDQCLKVLFTTAGKTFTITAGELGSMVYDGKNMELIPSLQIKPIDVTGAGDIYRGGFAYGIIQGWTLAECASFGNLVAAIQCARIGNVAAIPTKQEIELFKNVLVQKKEVNESTITNYFGQL